jgi:hypothetical protein
MEDPNAGRARCDNGIRMVDYEVEGYEEGRLS